MPARPWPRARPPRSPPPSPARSSRWPSGPTTRKSGAGPGDGPAPGASGCRPAASPPAPTRSSPTPSSPTRSSPTCRTRCAWPNCDGSSSMPEPLAECAAVSRTFGSFTAVDRVDLAVRAGEVVGLLGGNGAGKTTLIRLLLGLLPVSAGSVRLFGQPPSRATRRRIGYVPQTLGLYDDLTVAENLAFSGAVFSAPARTPASLRRYAGALVGDLPLGVARRAAFAQALAHAPDLLLLDEPTSGVDPLARARLWETIGEAAAAGAGAIVTTHNMEEAEECSRLVVMAAGRVVAVGTTKQIIGPE